MQQSFPLLALCLFVAPALAGAFLLPVGQGQVIVTGDLSVASRRFDGHGLALPQSTYRSDQLSGYLEYGWTPNISVIAAPTVQSRNALPAVNAVTGADGSGFGGRIGLYDAPGRVLSFQALVLPPAGGSARDTAGDLRIAFGQGFVLWGLPAFVDVEPGARVHGGSAPSEARLDLSAGIRPLPRLMLLVQDFASFAGARGAVARAAYDKLQGSLVYDLSGRWSLQLGGFRTIAGRNAIRETGPMVGAWYRY